jgi:leucyl/phenylalanyl-tRNA---protein transferase
MSLYALDNRLWFPPVDAAQEDGLLAIGGDLSVQRLLMAYERGIFPWYEGDVPVWWCPDPRFVLYPNELKVSKSMKQLFKRNVFTFTNNQAFSDVINNCKKINRPGQDGTWITNEVVASYKKMHAYGYAHSAETWLDGELVGGLYGVRLGKVFFGESMFSVVSNASKYAFISYVKQLKKEGVQLIDCQVYTEHLESLGAKMITRNEFIALLHNYIGEPG